MFFLERVKNDIIKALNLEQGSFSYPPDSKLGDLSLACFSLAKDKSLNPMELAKNLAIEASAKENLKSLFSRIEAIGPYVNFYFLPFVLATEVINEIKNFGSCYGNNENGGGQRVMIEYSNGNTHKEYHVGHLRNIAYGEAVKNLLNKNGCQAIPVSYINDFGIHAAKTIWNWNLSPVYEERPESKGFLLGKCYAQASQKLIDNNEGKEAVSSIMKNIESREGADYKLWQKTRQWSIDYFNNIYKELSIRFEHIFYESEVVDTGLKMVDDLLARGILKKSEGAIIADLSEYNLGVLPVIRSDGTALYPVADLALASEKFNRYNLDQSIYVVDVRQSLHFKQLFKVLELSGYKQPMIHLSYDFVTLPEGMMASRSGNVITYEDLKEKIKHHLADETAKRHSDWTPSRINHVAMSLTISTIKFEMLKVGAEKTITFNIEEAARFDGLTACYLIYSYARMKSLLRKGGFMCRLFKIDRTLLKETKEKDLLVKMAKYPEIISLASQKYNPSELTKYLFELSKMFNDYYHEVNILKADKSVKAARLLLVKNLSTLIFNAFSILGLEALEEM
jgi:arginyl-tRNA synthetase